MGQSVSTAHGQRQLPPLQLCWAPQSAEVVQLTGGPAWQRPAEQISPGPQLAFDWQGGVQAPSSQTRLAAQSASVVHSGRHA